MLVAALLCGDTITLKDEQVFEADVKGFDSYYLNVELTNGKTISIPWGEVRFIKHTTTASSWLEEEYMDAGDTDVTTLVAPLDPGVAFQKAVFPGIVMRGAGHFYAKDNNRGISLLSAEILSLIIMGMNAVDVLTHDENSQASGVTQAVFYGGLTIFVGSWLYDIIFAPGAAEEFNKNHEFYLDEPEKKTDEDR